MRRFFYVLLFFCLILCPALVGCGGTDGPHPEQVAARAAKVYYDELLKGHYEQFVDGRYQPDSIPQSYREQLVTNAKMFVGQQKEEHRGIQEVRIADAKADTVKHVAEVYLTLVYGDSTKEQVVVPMVEEKGVWYMR